MRTWNFPGKKRSRRLQAIKEVEKRIKNATSDKRREKAQAELDALKSRV